MVPKPEIYVVSPPPVIYDQYKSHSGRFENLLTFIQNEIYPKVLPELASQMGVHYINLHGAMGGRNQTISEKYSREFKDIETDGLHYGFPQIVRTIYGSILPQVMRMFSALRRAENN